MFRVLKKCVHSVAWVLLVAAFAGAASPNILLIVSDDQGWNDIGYHDAELRTPHLDRLAEEGVELDCHYVQPQCTPTRVALMTSRYPSRFGHQATHANNELAFPVGTPTLAGMLRQAGYATGMSGKWHLGSKPEWGPNHHGFDYSHGSLAGAVGMYDHRYRLNRPEYAVTWHRNHQMIEQVGHVTDLTTDEAVEWIEGHAGTEPWFFYVPLHAVHAPIVEGDPRWHALNAHIEDADRRFFAAALSHMDDAVGRMVEALDATGQRRNTVVIFTSDNGGVHNRYKGGAYPPPDPRLEKGFSSNTPLRGGKTEAFEGGIRVPAFVSWQGVLRPRKLHTPIHVVDWMPTLASLIGGDAEEYLPEQIDGRDVWPLLTGETAPGSLEQRTIYTVWGWGKSRDWEAVRHGDWKIVRRSSWRRWRLFNLSEDPGEAIDLAAEEPAVMSRLIAHYREERSLDHPELR